MASTLPAWGPHQQLFHQLLPQKTHLVTEQASVLPRVHTVGMYPSDMHHCWAVRKYGGLLSQTHAPKT